MGIESAKTGMLLYHLTKLENLESIIVNGLVPRRALLDSGALFNDVADPGIIDKRTQLGLDIYTPFHFHPYSSFDVAVKSKYSDEEFIYICITRENARFNQFKVLPKHPLSIDECTLLDYDDGFNQIDWEVMVQRGLTDDYAKQVKIAECLTEKRVPVNLFKSIAVKNAETKQKVEDMLRANNINGNPPYVNIQRWF